MFKNHLMYTEFMQLQCSYLMIWERSRCGWLGHDRINSLASCTRMFLSKVRLRANIWSILVVLGLLTRLGVSGLVSEHVMEFRKFYIKTHWYTVHGSVSANSICAGGQGCPVMAFNQIRFLRKICWLGDNIIYSAGVESKCLITHQMIFGDFVNCILVRV